MQTVSILSVKLKVMKCKIFTKGLASTALLWFHHLQPRSVDGYDELIRKFISNFSINVKVSKTPNDLLTIKQKNEESLKSYIERFNAEFINILDALITWPFQPLSWGCRMVQM